MVCRNAQSNIVMDSLSKAHRSWNMSRIRARNTHPEVRTRSILHRLGFRFRLEDSRLPGRPDIVLPRYRTVVLVHGCFWHRHKECKYAYSPKSRIGFWTKKFKRNVERDAEVRRLLRKLGWRIILVWECELSNEDKLQSRLRAALRNAKSHSRISLKKPASRF